MARHRSPEGRRAHLQPPLPPALVAAGVGGAYRTVAQRPTFASARPSASAGSSSFTSSTPVRFVAAAIAGTALAATGQHLLVQAVPMASDGAAALRAGLGELVGSTPARPAPVAADVPAGPIGAAAATSPLVASPLVTAPIGAVAPVGAEPVAVDPVVADAAGLVKAADLQRVAAEESARAAEQERARVAERARAEADRSADTEAADSEAAEAVAAAGGGVQVVDGTFTSAFGARNGRAHEGVDIAAPIGTPIHVPVDGTVIDSGPATGFGLWVRVRHEDGTITTYGHINRSFVTVGEEVTAGEVIAEVGNRGESSGPHLHFEVTTEAGTKINPRPWMTEFGATV